MPRCVTKRRPNRKRRHKEEVQQDIIQDKEKIWKTRQIFFKWLRIKQGANIFSLAMVYLSTSQAEVNVVIRASPVVFVFVGSFKVSQISQIYLMLYTLSNEYGFV